MNKLIIVLLAVCMSASAFAKDKDPQISEVFVTDTQIVILGSNFDEPEVSLGDAGSLVLAHPAEINVLVAILPADPMTAGDYKLTVSQGKDGKYLVSYDLTIGAVGPQGPQGEKGDTGPQGPTGIGFTNLSLKSSCRNYEFELGQQGVCDKPGYYSDDYDRDACTGNYYGPEQIRNDSQCLRVKSSPRWVNSGQICTWRSHPITYDATSVVKLCANMQ